MVTLLMSNNPNQLLIHNQVSVCSPCTNMSVFQVVLHTTCRFYCVVGSMQKRTFWFSLGTPYWTNFDFAKNPFELNPVDSCCCAFSICRPTLANGILHRAIRMCVLDDLPKLYEFYYTYLCDRIGETWSNHLDSVWFPL